MRARRCEVNGAAAVSELAAWILAVLAIGFSALILLLRRAPVAATPAAEETQRDARLDELERERVKANIMAELECKCPCHEHHDADLAAEAFWR